MRIPNISGLHRIIRVALGLAIVLIGINVLNGPPAICSAIFGSVIVLSGVFGYCPACAALKKRS